MRPPKTIFVVDPDENRLSVMCFTLKINGYRVLRAQGEQEALGWGKDTVDMVLIVERGRIDPAKLAKLKLPKAVQFDARRLIERLKRKRDVPVLLLTSEKPQDGDLFADQVASITCTTTELLERCKVMTAKKRGPKPQLKPATAIG